MTESRKEVTAEIKCQLVIVTDACLKDLAVLSWAAFQVSVQPQIVRDCPDWTLLKGKFGALLSSMDLGITHPNHFFFGFSSTCE